jgi:hypothetical protein
MRVEACTVSPPMRRGIEIRESFVPTRLSATYLRGAYEVVSPVVERIVVTTERIVAGEREHDGAVQRRRRQGGTR